MIYRWFFHLDIRGNVSFVTVTVAVVHVTVKLSSRSIAYPFWEIVSTLIAIRDPHSQRHVQAKMTWDIERSGSGGQAPSTILRIYILLWLRMPLQAAFKHFLETQNLATKP